MEAGTTGALGRWYPRLAGHLPARRFTTLPTPVTRLERVGGLRALWVKRDDLSGTVYAGNKPRKLEFILSAAQRAGRRSVITFGGLGSHHGIATAACGALLGLRTELVLVPQPVTEAVQRTLLTHHALGARMHFAPNVAGAAALAARLVVGGALRGDRPAVVPTGGTSPLGALGYVDAALELAEQIVNEELPEPGTIFVPLGSGGTVVGLTLGCRLAGLHTRVVGVLVTDKLAPSPAWLARIARATLRRLRRLDPSIPDIALRADDFPQLRDHLGGGYGVPSAEGEAAAAVAARYDLRLDDTYTAKAFAATLSYGPRPPYRDGPVLFWHTYSRADAGARLERLPAPAELPAAFHRFFRA